jgi:hypothetical protein
MESTARTAPKAETVGYWMTTALFRLQGAAVISW